MSCDVGKPDRFRRVSQSRTDRATALIAGVAVLIAAADSIGWGRTSGQARTEPVAPRLAVTDVASTLVDRGLAKAAPAASGGAAFQDVPHPALRFRIDNARATRAPWVDSNAWRFIRGISKARYAKLPAGSAPLAAAEAFTFDVDAILDPDPKDIGPLGTMLEFLKAEQRQPLPSLVNIEVVDDGGPAMEEVLNLLTRRNLLYRVVQSPQGRLDLTVKLGTREFPASDAANPYDFAAKVREKLGDDKRLLRLYGTSTTIARLTGDGTRARLYLLEYGAARDRMMGGGPDQTVRVRILGRYRPTKLAAHGAEADAKLTGVEHPGNTTEFWVPAFTTLAIIDLERLP
jgi:hypothetical protein